MMPRSSRILPALLLPAVAAGCQPTRPPSPAAQKIIKQQTATGPVNTKIQAKPFTYPVKSAELSLWDIKVFDRKDKDTGLRQEWKHFAQLPQQPGAQITNTQVLMNAWIISKDGTVFLPQKPTYKQYGSFYTDWTLPRAGDYTLWLEYQPSVAHNEELSAAELFNRQASIDLPREVAFWDFQAVGPSLPDPKTNADKGTPPSNGLPLKTYNARGELASEYVTIQRVPARAGQKIRWPWALNSGAAPLESPEIVAIAPDRSTLLHGIGKAPALTFPRAGAWKVWFSYTRAGQSFAAPYVLNVAP